MDAQGEFDQKKLAQVIFQDFKRRKAMEAVIHPLVRESFKQFTENQKKQGKNRVFYEAPLISLSLLDSCDKTVLITCSRSIREKRLLSKGWTKQEIKERLLSQIPDSVIKDRVDFIVDNDGDFKNLESQLEKILSLLNE